LRARLLPFHANCHSHPASDAERGTPFLHAQTLHGKEQGDQNAGARGGDRVSKSDPSSAHVHLSRVEAEVLDDRDGLRGKGFVQLKQVDVS
jgi:hypothetical protein